MSTQETTKTKRIIDVATIRTGRITVKVTTTEIGDERSHRIDIQEVGDYHSLVIDREEIDDWWDGSWDVSIHRFDECQEKVAEQELLAIQVDPWDWSGPFRCRMSDHVLRLDQFLTKEPTDASSDNPS